LVAVDARVNDKVLLLLLLDTGAERMMISRDAALRSGIDPSRPLRHERLAGVGMTMPVPVVRLNRVRVGGTAASDLLASVYDLPATLRADGVIGLNYLSQFRVTLEFDSRELILRPLRRSLPH